jgi:Ca2+-binding RTX toxin-like protein
VNFFGGIGNDTAVLINDSPNNIEMYGGEGDDLLLAAVGPVYMEGGGGSDLLVAGFVDANDTLLGGDGNDVLIGSGGADQLEGGEGEDLLVAAGFLFQEEEDPGDLLFAIWAEWGSSRTYAERVANISGTGVGPRNNGDYFIEPGVNIVNDDAVDVVLGEDDQDWLVYDFALDMAPDWQVTEVKTNIG